MVRRTFIAVSAAFALVVGAMVSPGGAQTGLCFVPDDEPPMVHRFDMGPSALPRDGDALSFYTNPDVRMVGTRVFAEVWDVPNVDLTNWHNGITQAVLEIPEAEIEEVMDPLPDGRYGKVRQPVEYVLPPGSLTPGELYTVRITGEDACGNATTREWKIRQLTFLVTVMCDNAPRGLC